MALFVPSSDVILDTRNTSTFSPGLLAPAAASRLRRVPIHHILLPVVKVQSPNHSTQVVPPPRNLRKNAASHRRHTLRMDR